MSEFLDLIDEHHTATSVAVTSKKALFEFIARHIAKIHPSLADEQLISALNQRERLGSTYIGEGIAVPHCRLDRNGKSIVGIFTLARPIIYNDDETVDIVALLLAPESASDEHLTLLSQIAKLLNQPQIRKNLRRAKSGRDIIKALNEEQSLDRVMSASRQA